MTVTPTGAEAQLGGIAPPPNLAVGDVAFADTEADEGALDGDGLLGGKYRVERALATGGMGKVVIAEHVDLGRQVAIKLLRRELVRDAKTAERFRLEAKTVAKLKSPHVVRVYDVGALEDDTPYIVMEYLEGEPLNHLLSRAGRLPPDEAVDIVLQALAGIAEAHAAGIVHRDLKPHNLFVTSRVDGARVIKVLDFGISKVAREIATGASTEGITQPNEILGTPIYMAPEQVTNTKDVDGRADLWSMGVILREMLSGERLFQAPSPSTVFANILRDPINELEGIPAGLSQALTRSLTRQREQRFASAAEMAAALAPFGLVHTPHSTPVQPCNLPPPVGPAAPRASLVDATPASIASAAPPAPTHRYWFILIASFGLGALAALWYFSRFSPETADENGAPIESSSTSTSASTDGQPTPSAETSGERPSGSATSLASPPSSASAPATPPSLTPAAPNHQPPPRRPADSGSGDIEADSRL